MNKQKRIWIVVSYTLFAVFINYLGSLIAEKIEFPLYLDSILTIGVTASCGLIPGIICAVLSNLTLSLWTHSSLLFGICHISTAVLAWIVFTIEEKSRLTLGQSSSKKFLLMHSSGQDCWLPLVTAF